MSDLVHMVVRNPGQWGGEIVTQADEDVRPGLFRYAGDVIAIEANEALVHERIGNMRYAEPPPAEPEGEPSPEE